jgi:hypothetical protein
MSLRVNYDQLASTYNQRYATGEVEGVANDPFLKKESCSQLALLTDRVPVRQI